MLNLAGSHMFDGTVPRFDQPGCLGFPLGFQLHRDGGGTIPR